MLDSVQGLSQYPHKENNEKRELDEPARCFVPSRSLSMRGRDVLTFGLICVAAGVLAPRPAFAQPKYPERSIKLAIPFAPGGLSDAVGLPWVDKMKTLLGPMFMENQGGAGGLVGGAAVARANPDGYTILLGSAGQILIPAAAGHGPYDPVKDLEPIAILVVAAL